MKRFTVKQHGTHTIIAADKFIQVDNTIQLYIDKECVALIQMDGGFSIVELRTTDGKCPDCGYAPGERNSELSKTYKKES